ncbi:patatin [Halarcobacter mediterraneus]|uniref:Patatin n=1 Tax=Halarcobacter mediterraneus TaxID=2023153 RepID=A0A4Q1AR86_9BACT|nr:patatin-like phospholipase family protein [Halarcobacter mediterraneus]RXK11517.1 patatin [Halarcobacter mediterraneus]
MSFALVLSGGAARGAFHLGVLHFLEEQNIKIEAYSGSSIGAIICTSHASGVKAKEQLKIFSSKDIKKAIKFNYLKKGLFRIDEKHPILKELLPINNLEEIPKKVYINAYDLKTKKLYYFDKGNTHSLCMASSALPPLFKPINYKNMQLIDGGLFDNMPIKPLENKNYTIYTLDLLPHQSKENNTKNNPFKFVKRKIFTQFIENAKYSKIHSDYYITSPKIHQFKMFTFKELKDCFNLGYKEAQKYF